MTLESSKNLGGVGAILMTIGTLGFLGAYTGILWLIGVILVLIAMKGLADHYKEAGIFNNALYGVIFVIVGVFAFIAAIVLTALTALAEIGIDMAALADWNAYGRIQWQELFGPNIVQLIIGVVISVVVLFVFIIIAAIFIRKSMSATADKTGVGMFGTVGLLTLIGAVLTIIVIGLILLVIAEILLIVAFFSIKTTQPQP